MENIFYSLIHEDIQNVSMEELDRKLSKEEIENIVDKISERIPWYDVIADTINEKYKS